MLDVKGVSIRFGGLTAVNDVSLQVKEKEIVGLIGTNGSGKSTLFNMVGGVYKPLSGKIYFMSEDITGKSPEKICRKGISRTFQIMKPFGSLTTLENVMVGANFGRKPDAGSKEPQLLEYCLNILRLTKLYEKRDVQVRDMTFAEQKRLELARALSARPRLLMLDEVMAGLNHTEITTYIDLIRELRQKGLTFLIIEHVMKAMMALTDRIYVLNAGQVIAHGTPQEVANDEDVIRLYLGTDMLA